MGEWGSGWRVIECVCGVCFICTVLLRMYVGGQVGGELLQAVRYAGVCVFFCSAAVSLVWLTNRTVRQEYLTTCGCCGYPRLDSDTDTIHTPLNTRAPHRPARPPQHRWDHVIEDDDGGDNDAAGVI